MNKTILVQLEQDFPESFVIESEKAGMKHLAIYVDRIKINIYKPVNEQAYIANIYNNCFPAFDTKEVHQLIFNLTRILEIYEWITPRIDDLFHS